jgi:hypothetical protein
MNNKHLKRQLELAGLLKENKPPKLPFELVKHGNNGKTYAIVRENKKYFIKEANTKEILKENDFHYLGGDVNKGRTYYNSYEDATVKLNLIFDSINESTDGKSVNILENDILNEKKYVLKLPKQTKSNTTDKGEEDFDFGGEEEFDFGGDEETDTQDTEGGEEDTEDFDFGDEEGTEEGGEEDTEDFDFGDEEGTEEGGDEDFDFGDEGDTEEGGEEGEVEDSGIDLGGDNIKSIQSLTGKLGQKLRDTEDLTSDMQKWVAKSVLSALNINNMDDNDKEDVLQSLSSKVEESDGGYYEDLDAPRGGDNTDDLLFDSDYIEPDDLNEYDGLYEYDIEMDAPAEPTTKPDVKPAPTRRRESPFKAPPYIKPGEEPRPKARDNSSYDRRRSYFNDDEQMMNEDHFNDRMETYEQEQQYEWLEGELRNMGLELSWCHKEKTNDPEKNTIYFDVKEGKEKIAKVRLNSAGQIEMGYMEGKTFIGEPIDSVDDIYELLDEVNLDESMETMYDIEMDAPAEPTTKPDVKPAPPRRRESPFKAPPYIKPGEEPRPKARSVREDRDGEDYLNDKI